MRKRFDAGRVVSNAGADDGVAGRLDTLLPVREIFLRKMPGSLQL